MPNKNVNMHVTYPSRYHVFYLVNAFLFPPPRSLVAAGSRGKARLANPFESGSFHKKLFRKSNNFDFAASFQDLDKISTGSIFSLGAKVQNLIGHVTIQFSNIFLIGQSGSISPFLRRVSQPMSAREAKLEAPTHL